MHNLDFLQPEPFKVVDRKQETVNSFTLTLRAFDNSPVSFLPGQFNMLYAFGIGEVPISFSGDPGNEHDTIHTIKVVGNVTQALSRIEVGETIGLRGPYGNSWPIEKLKNRDMVIIAGGIGLAPLRSMIYHMLRHRDEFGKIAILYGARDPSDLLYFEEMKTWTHPFEENVFITVDFADLSWKGHVGVVTTLLPLVPFDLRNCAALLCGPEIMLRFAVRELLMKNLPATDIFLAMERNMKCAIGHCGRCQYVQNFVCKDGAVLPYSSVEPFFNKKEV